MTREEAIEILKKNRPGADPRRCGLELCTAVDVAIAALMEQEELARNLHDVASCEQVTEPLQRNGSSDSEVSLATKKQVKCIRMMARPWQPQDLLDDLQLLIGEEPDRYLNDRRTTLCMARDFLKEHFAEPRWISVAERLPDKKGEYLTYDQWGYGAVIKTAYWTPKHDGFDEYLRGRAIWHNYDSKYGCYELTGITHWMPLPEPPKEGGEH